MSIIPTKDAIPFDQLDLDHLTPSTARHLKNTLKPYQSIFAKSKFDLGTFTGFEVDAEVVPKPGIRCRQTPRNKILPQNCIDNISNYIDAELFKPSDSGADEFCANITLVKRSSAPGAVKLTKADKHILKQTNEKQNDANTLYRATVDFRMVNYCTKSP